MSSKPNQLENMSSYECETHQNKGNVSLMSVVEPEKQLFNNGLNDKQPWQDALVPEGYELNNEGLFKSSSENRTQGLIANPIWVEAITEDVYTEQFGMAICWIDLRGKLKKAPFNRSLLFDQGGALVKALLAQGLSITPGKERELKAYLGNSTNICSIFIKSVSRLGWLSIESGSGQMAYILPPDKVIGGQLHEPVQFSPERFSPTINTIDERGTLKDWQIRIMEPCRGNPYLLFSLCTAFAAPLLKLVNMESGGFHLYGHSSRGKTTAAQVAASVFGCGADPSEDSERAYIQRWNATGNALEALASAHNDGLLILDELHSCDSKEFGRIIYNLFGGMGKKRLNKDSQIQQSRAWRLLVLSTGEKSSQVHIEEASKKVYAGQKARLVDIPIGDDNIIEDTKGITKADFAINLKRACAEYYGVAAIKYLDWLIFKFENLSHARYFLDDRLRTYTKRLVGENSQPEHERVIRRFALVYLASELAIESGVLPLDMAETLNAIEQIKSAWCNAETNLPDHELGAIKVRDFLLRHPSRFMPTSDLNFVTPRDLAGYTNSDYFMLTPEGFTEACGSYDTISVAKYLANLGFLEKESGRLQKKVQIRSGIRPRCYVIKKNYLDS